MSDETHQREPKDRRGYKRSPVTLPEFRRGRPNPYKGKKNPAEVLLKSEYRALLESFEPTTSLGVRDRAMVMLMYAGLKISQVLALERRHYEPGSQTLTVPESKFHGEREMTLDAGTRAALDRWMELRKAAGVRARSPLFCVLNGPTKGAPVHDSHIRQKLTNNAERLGIDRKVNPAGLKLSGETHRAQTHGRLLGQLVGVVDEADLESRYRDAFEIWEAAVQKFEGDIRREGRRIGEDCRAALESFINTALKRHQIDIPSSGTVTKLRGFVAAVGPKSETVSAHLDALINYWGTVSDLDQRQAHEGNREGEKLTREDARRAILYTLLIMVEVDRVLPTKKR